MERQLKPGRYCLQREDVLNLIAVTDNIRDKALLGLMGLAGLRREECTKIRITDINLEKRRLIVKGKLNKIREIPISPLLVEIIMAQSNAVIRFTLDSREIKYVPGKEPFLFPSKMNPLNSINNLTVNRVVANAGVRIGLKNPDPSKKNINPHILRHSYAHYLKSKGISLETIRDVLGHSSISITADTYGLATINDIQKELESIN